MILLLEGAIPGAYQNICMSLPERSIILKSTGDEIKIYQGTGTGTTTTSSIDNNNNNGGSVTGRTGVALWNSGLLLSRLLDEISFTMMKKQIFDEKIVMELGCGTGFASIVASKLGAKYVYATDGNQEVLKLTKVNLERNGIFPYTDDNNKSATISSARSGDEYTRINNGEACSLQWGSLDSIDYYDTADVIIGSDLTYNSGSWRLLVDTISSVLKPKGYFLYLTLGHSGFNVSGELNGFLTVVQSYGLLDVIDENNADWPFPGVESLELLLLSSLSEKETTLTRATGGFKIVVLRPKQRKKIK